MAGSYEHLLPREQGDPGWSKIENMGDAYECVEELFWLVEKCIGREEAKQQLRLSFYPMKRGEIPKDTVLEFVEQQMQL